MRPATARDWAIILVPISTVLLVLAVKLLLPRPKPRAFLILGMVSTIFVVFCLFTAIFGMLPLGVILPLTIASSLFSVVMSFWAAKLAREMGTGGSRN